MKRTIAIYVLAGMLLALCGCGNVTAPGETTEPFVSTAPAQTREPTAGPTTPQTDPTVGDPLPPVGTDITAPVQPEPGDGDFVPVLDYIPDLIVELKYSSEDNFTGQTIYSFQDAYMRYGTVKKLLSAQQTLREKGLGLKIWDAFRPVSAQHVLWKVCPDPMFVANPESGFSSHSRGNTVDITLVDSSGQELTMPTAFDDFSPLADRDYSDCTREAAENAMLLQDVLEAAGFTGYYGEWWHFSDTVSYPVEELFTPLPPQWRYALCDEYITLREHPEVSAPELIRIPKEGGFLVLARHGDFLMVYCQGLRGYVLERFTTDMS